MRVKSFFVIISFHIGLAFAQRAILSELFKFLNSEGSPLIDALSDQDITQFLSLLTSNVTLLVPISVPNGTLSQLLANTGQILPLLTYHVATVPLTNSSFAQSPNHTVIPTFLSASSEVSLQNGARQSLIATTGSDGAINILNQPTDVTFSAGQSIPVIDISYGYGIISDLLVVPSSIDDTLQGDKLSAFDTESSVANITGTLAAQHGVTVFVPEDSAFNSANGMLKGRSGAQLAAVLNSHVVNGTFYSTQLGGSQLNILGQNLTFKGNTVTIQGGNSANIVQSDILVDNGVLHTIDAVLLKSGAVKRVIEGAWITAAVAAVLCGSALAM